MAELKGGDVRWSLVARPCGLCGLTHRGGWEAQALDASTCHAGRVASILSLTPEKGGGMRMPSLESRPHNLAKATLDRSHVTGTTAEQVRTEVHMLYAARPL